MIGALCNCDRCAVGIVVGIGRILVIGLNAFHTCADGNINFACHNTRVYTDRLCAVACLCGDGTAVDIHGAGTAGGTRHNANSGLTGCYYGCQCTGTAALTVNVKR